MKNIDYYEVLGLPRDADAKAIRNAFRHLAMKYHPDRNKEPDAEERFKEIAEAYAVLSDPKKRAEYDARGHAGIEGFSTEDLYGGIDFEDIFGRHDFGFDFGLGGGSLFDRFFGGGRPRPAGPPRGGNIEVRLDIPLARVVTGGEERVRLRRRAVCPLCHGHGADPGTPPRRCPECGGSGRKTVSSRKGGMTFRQITTCPACYGRGEIVEKFCPQCGGLGETEREETLKVKIPIGVDEGMALRIPGHGSPGREPGGMPGDLYVVIHTLSDPRFDRRGADLWRTESLDITDAVLGAKLKVPTLEGSVSVSIPPSTQLDEVLRLHGKGLPEYGGAHRGDLYLRIQVRVPERLSGEEAHLWEELRKLRKNS
jgi:molecular chaperone DnaJ